MKKTTFILITLLSVAIYAGAQDKKTEKATQLTKDAMVKIDSSDFKGAIKLLKKAVKLNPANTNIKYQLAYSYYKIGNYTEAIKLTEVFLPGHQFDDTRKYIKDLYKKANVEFKYALKPPPPKPLVTAQDYRDTALVLLNSDPDKAIQYINTAIDMEPANPENYYHAAKLYFNTPEIIWTIIYSETFVLLENNTARTEEMKKLLFEAYQKAILIKSAGNYQLSFSQKKAEFPLKDFNPKDFKVNFQQSYSSTYEMCTDKLDDGGFRISNLYFMRKDFIKYWFMGKQNEYPSFLFDFQSKMIDENVFEGYNYWLFKSVLPTEYTDWSKYFSNDYQRFETWISTHKPDITDANNLNAFRN